MRGEHYLHGAGGLAGGAVGGCEHVAVRDEGAATPGGLAVTGH